MYDLVKEKIDFCYINKKGKEKNVSVYVDKTTYKLIRDSDLDESIIINYLKDIYLESNREKYLKRKEKKFKEILLMNGSYEFIESPEEFYDKMVYKDKLRTCLNNLKLVERQIIDLIFFKGKRIVDVANILNKNKSTISKRLKVILNKLNKELNNK